MFGEKEHYFSTVFRNSYFFCGFRNIFDKIFFDHIQMIFSRIEPQNRHLVAPLNYSSSFSFWNKMQIIWQKTSSDFFSQKFSPPLQLSHKSLNKSFWVFVANVCWFSIQRIHYADRNWHMHIFKNERFCWFFSLIFVTKRFKIKKEGVRVNLCFWFSLGCATIFPTSQDQTSTA